MKTKESKIKTALLDIFGWNQSDNKIHSIIVILMLIWILKPSSCHSQTLLQRIPDDVNHYTISCNMASFGSIALYKLSDRPVLSCLIATMVSVLIGAAKERLYDGMLNKGTENYEKDFVADVRGSITGGFFAGMAIVLKKNHEQDLELERQELAAKYQNLAPLPKFIELDYIEPIQITHIDNDIPMVLELK